MSDIKELNDDDLEKVSGGIRYGGVIGVDAGDVFIDKINNNMGYVVTVATNNEGDDTPVPCKLIYKTNGQWQTYESGSTTKKFSILMSDYQYSAELTGTINY